MDPSSWVIPPGWIMLVVGVLARPYEHTPSTALPAGFAVRTESVMQTAGVTYVDVLAACDCVVGKVGMSSNVLHCRLFCLRMYLRP